MSIVVIKQGLLDTIQDEGRFGFQHVGINPNGCMDTIASNIANILVGNDRTASVIEMHFPASCFKFNEDYLIALSGADFQPTINDQTIAINKPVYVSKESILKFSVYNKGGRCYMAVAGGFNIGPWLDSHSTNIKAGAGGYHGRALRKDDVIEVGKAEVENRKWKAGRRLCIDVTELYRSTDSIRCIAGSEYEWLDSNSKNNLLTSFFHITVQSDRMGYRLKGDDLKSQLPQQLLSTAVTKGTIQLLPAGQLIILMADHQTTGGYPKVAHVISADLPTLAQLRPNETIRFELVNIEEAEDSLFQQQQYLQQLEQDIKLHLE